MAIDEETLKQYLADDPPTVVPLAIKPHFDALSDEEKLYAHYISLAAFSGTRIVLRQTSPESEQIYDFIIALHFAFNGDWTKSPLSTSETRAFLSYSAQFLGNLGNYKSFGDTKFLPRLSSSSLASLAEAGGAKAKKLYEELKNKIVVDPESSPDDRGFLLGYPDRGHVSTYYPDSPDVTLPEITVVSDFLESKGLLPENTRLRKLSNEKYEVLIASADKSPSEDERDLKETKWTIPEDQNLGGTEISLKFGDHSREMDLIADALAKASLHAANDTQKSMMEEYVKSFRTGSLQAYKESQRLWIRDKGPMVESDIGFVETYRDPHGIRAEWEGFAAVVNKERTRAFAKLVEAAPDLIPLLPWDKSFEKDKFLSPDFTSLEVLTFAGSGIPAGINIPNYDDIRQTEGFKNVSLGNVLSAKSPDEKIPFIHASDLEVYRNNRDAAFEVQVGLHELLGHGCGKLLQETSPGKFNFDPSNPPISPLTKRPITTWYKPGQTWSSVFGPLAASYEECRAECVAMALSCDFSVLEIFGFGNGTEDINGPAGDILYAGYLSMARAGLAALEFWDPKSAKWGQAHMQARFSILQTFLHASEKFAWLEYDEGGNLDDLVVRIAREHILTIGRSAVESYLLALHVNKATADFAAGGKMYEEITHVDSFWKDKVRPAVLRKKVPRKVFVQANTFEEGGKVSLKEYESTPEGMIQSYADREYI